MRYIKLYEKFGEIDIRKEDLKNSIHDALIELVDNNFDIDVEFNDNLGIKIDISNKFNTFEIDEIKDHIDVLIDYIKELFGEVSVEYLINSRLFNLNGKYNTIQDFIDKRDEELTKRQDRLSISYLCRTGLRLTDFGNYTSNTKKVILVSVIFKNK